MNPILYESTETAFTTFGIGVLSDAISCTVEEERNGAYELTLEYPISGKHYADIAVRRIICAKPNFTGDIQPFRIYKIDRQLSGKVTIYAQHISYDLSGYVCTPFTASSIQAALRGLALHSTASCPFIFTSTKTTASEFKVDVPSSIRSWLGGKTGSLLDIYGGEWKFDKFVCTLYDNRGTDRGVEIRYGKNLIQLEQETNCSNVYTGVICYWSKDDEVVYGSVVNTWLSASFVRILSVDCSDLYEEKPTAATLTSYATTYINAHKLSTPKINITLDFVQIGTLKDRVDLCDTVKVYFEKLRVYATAKCIRTVWDVLAGRYTECELGDARSNLAETIVDISSTASKAVTSSALERAISDATTAITTASGGHYMLLDTDNDGAWDEAVIMDTTDTSTATKVWRWNIGGFGFSTNGYDGTYTTAIYRDSTGIPAIVANYITTGTMSAARVRSGLLEAEVGDSYWDLSSGDFFTGSSGGSSMFWDQSEGTLTVTGTLYADAGRIAEFSIETVTNNDITYTRLSSLGKIDDTYYYGGLWGCTNITSAATSWLWGAKTGSSNVSEIMTTTAACRYNGHIECVALENSDYSDDLTISAEGYLTLEGASGIKLVDSAYFGDGTTYYINDSGAAHLASLTLGTPLPLAQGGTGATTAAAACTNLGISASASQTTGDIIGTINYGGNSVTLYSGISQNTGFYLPVTGGIMTGSIETGQSGLSLGVQIYPWGRIFCTTMGIGNLTTDPSFYFYGNYIYYAGTLAQASDKSIKQDICELTLDEFYDALKPVSYRMIDKYNDNNIHFGFIANDIKDSLKNKDDTYAVLNKNHDGLLTLSYIEFIALNTAQIQKLKKRVAELENKIQEMST